MADSQSLFSLSDLIALVSLVASGYAAYKAYTLEGKLQQHEDKLFAFDQAVTTPIATKLDTLQSCLFKIANVAADHDERDQRVLAISALQRSELDHWYFAFDALCEDPNPTFVLIRTKLEGFWDGLLESINGMNADLSSAALGDKRRQIIASGERFIAAVKGFASAERLKV